MMSAVDLQKYNDIHDLIYASQHIQDHTLLEMEAVFFTWNAHSKKEIPVLHNASLSLYPKEICSIFGNTGSGKSSLARLLIGSVRPNAGIIKLCGTPLDYRMTKKALYQRARVQLMPQIPSNSFNPFLSIYDGILDAYTLFYHYYHSIFSTMSPHECKREFRRYVELLSEYFHVDKTLLKVMPHRVSGGQLQRFALIRSLLAFPQVLVLDEPVSHLDVGIRKITLDVIRQIQKDTNLSIVLISHLKEIHEYMKKSQSTRSYKIEHTSLYLC